jgi:hypothetical protein
MWSLSHPLSAIFVPPIRPTLEPLWISPQPCPQFLQDISLHPPLNFRMKRPTESLGKDKFSHDCLGWNITLHCTFFYTIPPASNIKQMYWLNNAFLASSALRVHHVKLISPPPMLWSQTTPSGYWVKGPSGSLAQKVQTGVTAPGLSKQKGTSLGTTFCQVAGFIRHFNNFMEAKGDGM